MRFRDRKDAGHKLAEKLEKFKGEDVIVYALPRGGVVLGYEIAKHIGAPLDIIVTRKIGHPQNVEYAVCAIAEDGHMICNEEERARIDQKWFYGEVEREKNEAERRRRTYMEGIKLPEPEGKTAIIVDDGIATGLTLEMAVREIKHRKPAKIVVAVPVAPPDAADAIQKQVDEFVALDVPQVYLGAVGAYYDNFGQTTDEEVIALLNKQLERV